MWAPRPARGDPSSWGSCCFETVCTLLVLSSLGIYMDIIGLGACLLFLVSVLHHWHADNRKPGWQRGLVPFFHLPPEFFLCGNIATTPGGYAGRGGGCGVSYGGGAGAGSRGGGAGRGGVGCRGGGCWGPRRGCWAGVVWGAVGAGAGSRGGGAGRGGVGCRGGGCWEPRRGYWAGWWGVPWGAGAGSRGGVAGSGGVGCRGGGCWEPRRGYWAWWWGCCGNWGWGPQRGQRRGSVGGAWGVVLGAAEGQIKLVWSPPLLL